MRHLTREDIVENYRKFCLEYCKDNWSACSTCPINERLKPEEKLQKPQLADGICSPHSLVIALSNPEKFLRGDLELIFAERRVEDLKFKVALELGCAEHTEPHPRCQACLAIKGKLSFDITKEKK